MDKMKVAVIAGTCVDTQMGVEFLISKWINALEYPASIGPKEQSISQILSPLELEKIIRRLIKKIKYENITTIMIYCNLHWKICIYSYSQSSRTNVQNDMYEIM